MARKQDVQKRQRKLEQKRKKQRRRDNKRAARCYGSSMVGRTRSRAVGIAVEAHELCDLGNYGEARELLEEYTRDHKASVEILRLLGDIYYELGDHHCLCQVCEQLLEHEPSPPGQLMLAGAYLADGRLATALLAFEEYLTNWPDDPIAEEVRNQVASLKPAVDELLETTPFPYDQRYELAAMHEEVLALLGVDWERAAGVAEALLARCPGFVSALNNVTQIYFQLGRVDAAVASARKVLEKEPANVHAVGNLVRIYCLTDRRGEAVELAHRFQDAHLETSEHYCKQAESLTFLGDDDGIIALLQQAEQARAMRTKSPDVALFYHLAAAAFARQDDRRAAKKYWRKALKAQPRFDLAEENLDDLKRPAGDRHGPWSYGIENWLPRAVIEGLMSKLAEDSTQSDSKVERIVAAYVKSHPWITALVRELFRRGDVVACEFAVRFAFLLGTPEMYEALAKFAHGIRGSDEMRLDTLHHLSELELLSSGAERMWIRGKWTEIECFGLEITDEPADVGHSPAVERLGEQALEALRDDRAEEAEKLLLEALQLEPDKPDLLNNLGAAYEGQKRYKEAIRLTYDIHRRWPDYFFGRIGMTNICIEEKRFSDAEQYLEPLRNRRKLHHSEFTALCIANIRLHVAQKDVEAAEKWFQLWEDVQPDHPQQDRFQALQLTTALRRIAEREKEES